MPTQEPGSPDNPNPRQAAGRGDGTRDALIRAATLIFARDGFHAAGTRAVAQAAGANQALINYHFGGKQGLYLAVFDHIATQMQARHGVVAARIGEVLQAPDTCIDEAARRARYLPLVQAVCEGFLNMMLSKETEHWSQLIMREQQQPTEAFNRLYDGFMGRMLGMLTLLVQRLRGEADDRTARVVVVGLLGQILVWRIARAGISRHLGWQEIGPEQMAEARRALRDAVTAHVYQTREHHEI